MRRPEIAPATSSHGNSGTSEDYNQSTNIRNDKPARFGISRKFASSERIRWVDQELDQILKARRSESPAVKSIVENQVCDYGEGWIFQENLWKQSKHLEQWLLEGEPAQLVANLIESDQAWLLRDQTYFKAPGSEHTPWHQDSLFIPAEGCEVLTLWIPLTGIQSTHDSPLIYWDDSSQACHLAEQMNQLDRHNQQQKDWLEAGWTQVSTSGLSLGDCSFHSGWTLHGSGPLSGDRSRKAYVVVYGVGEGRISVKPALTACPAGLRAQAWMLRQGLQQVCFAGLLDGTPVPTRHNPWIRAEPQGKRP